MAASKKYAYYIEGNKIALVEEGTDTGMGTCSLSQHKNQAACENAGGTWTKASTSGSDYGKYKSPQTAVSDGLEIKYTYVPDYRVANAGVVDVNKFYVNGWTVINGYLTFLRARRATITNWTSSPESAVTSGTSGGSNDYIVVRGSSQWDGLHKVQTAGTEGELITYTKVNESLPYWTDQNVDFNTSEEIFGRSGGSLYLADYFAANDYVFISGSNDEANNGLFSVSSVSTSATVNSSKLTLGTRYAVVNSADATSYSTGLDNEYSADAALAAETSQSDINVFKANRDFCYIMTDVTRMEDESFELDIPRYLQNALVYYIKSRLAEELQDIEKMLFFQREFKRQIEKHNSGKITTTHRIQGFWQMNRKF